MVLRSARSAPRAGRKRRVLAVAALLVCVLAACAPGPRPEPSGRASATSTPSVTATSTPAAPMVTIDSPMAEAPVTVPVTIKGTAGTADSRLVVDLLDADGHPLCVRHITTTPGAGTPATWHTDLAFEPPDAEQDVTLRAYTQSAADGSAENVVEVPLTLTTERPPIIITSPGCGDTVTPGGALTVLGRALVPEAQFTLELRDASGAALLTQDVTAADGTQESDFSATLDIPAGLSAGFYDLVGFDNSLKDGSEQYDFPVQLIVQ